MNDILYALSSFLEEGIEFDDAEQCVADEFNISPIDVRVQFQMNLMAFNRHCSLARS